MIDSVINRRRLLQLAIAGSGSLLLPTQYGLAATTTSTSIVETAQGKVRGQAVAGISRFLGIPYGDDTSQNRFQPPQRAQSWAGIRDCFSAGAKAPQGAITISGVMNSGKPGGPGIPVIMAVGGATMGNMQQSEDCLVLNVYTPEASSRKKRPVMVWLHGGGFAMGSGYDRMTEGSELARQGDIVIVSLNHRLNALGYLYLGGFHNDFADSGNSGTLDILLALQWVQENIEAFGGDPDNVTIFGESGGGCKVGTLLGTPAARGLFHKAIEQSGPAVKLVSKDDANDIAERTLSLLGINKSQVHKLQQMDYTAVIKAASSVSQRSPTRGIIEDTLAPLVDERNIPAHPFDPKATNLSRDVPLMIGSCKDECTLFMASDGAFANMSVDDARKRFEIVLGEQADSALAIYRKAQPNDPPTYWVSSLMTDLMFRNGSILQADRKSLQNAAPVYMYRVDFQPRVINQVLRTPHGTEVPLMFGTKLPEEFIGSGPEVDKLSTIMMQAWINFSHSGNPSQEALAWPQYDTTQRLQMIFDTPCSVEADPDRITREYWQS